MRAFVAVAVILAAGWRVAFLIWTYCGIEADEATVGLMAKHIAEGHDFPVWYYGQEYMGALEAYVGAPFYLLFGAHPLTLKLTAFSFALVFSLTSALLAWRVFEGSARAWATGVYLALSPLVLTLWTLKLRGGFVSTLALGHVVLLLAFLLGTRGATLRGSLALGFVAGVATWVNFLVFPYIAAAGLYLLSRRQVFNRIAPFGACVAGFIIGSTPLWAYNVSRNWPTFHNLLHDAGYKDARGNVTTILERHIRMLLGEHPPWQDAGATPRWGWIVTGLLLVAAIAFTWRERRSLARFLIASRRPTSGAELYFLVAAAYLAAAAGTRFGHDDEPRYSIVLYTFIAPAFGSLAGGLWERGLPGRAAATLLGVALAGVNAWSIYSFSRLWPAQPFHFVNAALSPDWSATYELLDRERIHAVRAEYWVGYRMMYESGERFVTTPGRSRDADAAYAAAPRHAWLYRDVPSEQGTINDNIAHLKTLGLFGHSEKTGFFRLIVPEEGLPTAGWTGQTSGGQDPGSAWDRDPETRWTTFEEQRPGQWLTLDTGRIEDVSAVGLLFGKGDEPRAVRVEASLDGKAWTTIAEQSSAPPTAWRIPLPGGHLRCLRLTQNGKSDRWWSVHEIYLLPR
jgi:4-amino-4-deoxy-L-arabinose transferase-like glycosyltransferase